MKPCVSAATIWYKLARFTCIESRDIPSQLAAGVGDAIGYSGVPDFGTGSLASVPSPWNNANDRLTFLEVR